eukprot:6171308-Amphidinium_carterae.1
MYEAGNEQGTITNHVKIATIINNLKGPIQKHLMLRINSTTTFTEVHHRSAIFSIAPTVAQVKNMGQLELSSTTRQRTTAT